MMSDGFEWRPVALLKPHVYGKSLTHVLVLIESLEKFVSVVVVSPVAS